MFLDPNEPSAKAKDIHTELAELLGSHAFAYSMVTKHMRNRGLLQNEPKVEDRAEDQSLSMTDNAILEALKDAIFYYSPHREDDIHSSSNWISPLDEIASPRHEATAFASPLTLGSSKQARIIMSSCQRVTEAA
jgi:hypothetical protein